MAKDWSFWISDKGRASIEAAVREAEKKTSAEIVPAIIRRSSTVGHVFPLLFAVLFILYLLSPLRALGEDSWGGFDWYFLLAVGTIALFSWVLSRAPFVQRLCTLAQDRFVQVDQRAEIEFFERIASRTDGKTGVLLFLSLMERRAVLLAEKSIHENFGQESWNKVIAHLSVNAHKKGVEVAFTTAIEELGNILAEKLPVQQDDVDEIQNHLILLED